MRVAAFGDIHSNLYALESVLADIESKNVDFIICTGDSIGYSPYPNEVLNLLRKNNIISVQGNYEKAIGNFEMLCGCDYKDERLILLAEKSMEFTHRHISDANRDYVRNLPKQLRLSCGNFNMLVVHGSPRRINEPLLENSIELEQVLNETSENILVCGHTHQPYYKIKNGKHVINCGTVGKPVNGSIHSSYALIEVKGEEVSVELQSVPYDVEKAAASIEACPELPDDFAEMLRKGNQ